PVIADDPEAGAAGATDPEAIAPTDGMVDADASPESVGAAATAATDPCVVAPTGAGAGVNSGTSASASGSCANAVMPTSAADAATEDTGEAPVADAAPAIAPAVTVPTRLGGTDRVTQPAAPASGGVPTANVAVTGSG